MKKCLFLILLFIFITNCNKNKTVNKVEHKITAEKINFQKYNFNTTSKIKEKIVLTQGVTYVLDFWYLECPPCVKDHFLIKKSIASLDKENVKVIGISIDRNTNNWIEYLLEHNYNWQNYNQFKGDFNLKEDLGIKLFPIYIVVNDKGKIQEKFHSFKYVLKYLSKI
ncbi:TlpA family protein disulfide reductase [Polaribacter sp. Asnod1-A03]|uniref:TlpA family protein disulfide reductase n=1 Tax=Polaribacter sp. Asnod1-A03 TaxID=3160581 RepID=UPI003868A466